MAGAAVVSEFSTDLSEQFGDGEEVLFFNRARPAEVATGAASLLEADGGEQMAHKGHERAMRSALWSHRAERLVEFVAGESGGGI